MTQDKLNFGLRGHVETIKKSFWGVSLKKCKECDIKSDSHMFRVVHAIGIGRVDWMYCPDCAPTMEVAWKKTCKILIPFLKREIEEKEASIKAGEELED